MPELPEVEFARRSLVRWFDGRRLVRAEADATVRTFRADDASVPHAVAAKQFEQLTGTLERAERRGKYLMLAFSNGQGVVAHLGMSGKFVKRPPGQPVNWSRARFVLDTNEVIHFSDPRMFGRIEPMAAGLLRQNAAVVALGRDPLVDGLSTAQLREALGSSRQDLKVALMDQGRVTGLGNIHAAEALFRAKLHPGRTPGSLSDAEWEALKAGIDASLAFALELQQGQDDIEYVEEPNAKNPFLIYGREDEPCQVCGSTVARFDQGGRSTFFCPSCQVAAKSQKPATKPKAKVAPKKPVAAKKKPSPPKKTKKRS
jgi:formamidopyrimidine-DNA glycosylase